MASVGVIEGARCNYKRRKRDEAQARARALQPAAQITPAPPSPGRPAHARGPGPPALYWCRGGRGAGVCHWEGCGGGVQGEVQGTREPGLVGCRRAAHVVSLSRARA
jgi:hypothetical protein